MEVASSFASRLNPLPMFGIKSNSSSTGPSSVPNPQQSQQQQQQPLPSSNERAKQKARKRISTKQLEKPYLECKWDKCGQIFRSTIDLKDHLEEHLGRGNSKYVCLWEDCNFGERRKRDHMKSHIRKHHQHIGFHCTKCGMGFVRDQELRQHTCGQSQPQLTSSESSDEAETLPTTSSPGYPTSPPTSSSDTDASVSSPYREPMYYYSQNQIPQGVSYSQNTNSYCNTEIGSNLKRERSYDDVLSWIEDLDSDTTSSQDISLNTEVFHRIDGLMDKFDEDPNCFDEYIELLKPHTQYFKKIRQTVEDYKLSNDDDIFAILESNQMALNTNTAPIIHQEFVAQPQVYQNPQVYQSPQVYQNPQVYQSPQVYQNAQYYQGQNFQTPQNGFFSTASVQQIDTFNDQIYIGHDAPQTINEASVHFAPQVQLNHTYAKKTTEESSSGSSASSSDEDDELVSSLQHMRIADKNISQATKPSQKKIETKERKKHRTLKEYLDFIEVITSFGP